jgi:ankyrin repeat protein
MFRVSYALAALVALAAPMAASAQNFSEGYQFLDAIKKADGNKVDEILNKPGNTIINTKDRDTGMTALHIVTQREDGTYMRFLLQKGAAPNSTDKDGNTAMMYAVGRSYGDGVDILIRYGGSVNIANSSGETPLIRAVQIRNIDIIHKLLDAGADPDKTDLLAGKSARDYALEDRRNPAIGKLLADTPKKKANAGIAGPK